MVGGKQRVGAWWMVSRGWARLRAPQEAFGGAGWALRGCVACAADELARSTGTLRLGMLRSHGAQVRCCWIDHSLSQPAQH